VIADHVNFDQGAFLVIAVIGTVAFATSGVIAAAEAGHDWLGAAVLAVVVAVGGGTIRDLLVGMIPVIWVRDEWPVWVSLGTAVVGLVALRLRPGTDPRRQFWYLASDAVGLGAFVVLGASIAIGSGTSSFMAVFMGVVTGVGGGVIRDVFTGRTPMVFVGQVYAVAGIIGATAHVLLHRANAVEGLQVWLPVAVVVAVRALAIRFDLHLPRASGR